MPNQERQDFKELRFTGGRFDETEGFLDSAVLSEIEVYRRILVETAKGLWRAEHPERTYLPSGFEARFRLGIESVNEGSCAVSLGRVKSIGDDQLPMSIPDEFDQARGLVDKTLVAIDQDEPFPDNMTHAALYELERWGETLTNDESIVLGARNGRVSAFNSSIKNELFDRLTKSTDYEDLVDETGEIRAASLRSTHGGSFKIRLRNEQEVDGIFTNDQESDIISALHDHQSVHLRINGRGVYDGNGQLKRISIVESYELIDAGKIPFDPDAPSILETIKKIRESVPDSAWDNVPRDGSINYKHYLYGWPKVNEK